MYDSKHQRNFGLHFKRARRVVEREDFTRLKKVQKSKEERIKEAELEMDAAIRALATIPFLT
jgi:hypothetical protein